MKPVSANDSPHATAPESKPDAAGRRLVVDVDLERHAGGRRAQDRAGPEGDRLAVRVAAGRSLGPVMLGRPSRPTGDERHGGGGVTETYLSSLPQGALAEPCVGQTGGASGSP